MRISQDGVEFLERHEGVVLKAYRDIVGVWTIGAGLTAGSGVVRPKAGMSISRAEASHLLRLALARNYEPRVLKALGAGQAQHVFDGAVSFDFNTGAIDRASWVARWLAGDVRGFEAAFKQWRKAGGKVVMGLIKRRDAEVALIRFGDYHRELEAHQGPGFARVSLSLTYAEAVEVHSGFARLGYRPGSTPDRILETAARAFQRDHDLTVDGIIGPATLSTLQRMLDARKAPAKPAAAAVATGTGSVTAAEFAALPEWVLPLGVGLCVLWAGYLAWHYRDAVAAKIATTAPGFARWLRSF